MGHYLDPAAVRKYWAIATWGSVPLADRVDGAKAAYDYLLDPEARGGTSIIRFVDVFGELTLPHLSRLLSHPLPEYRMAATQALPYFHNPDQQLIEALASCLSGDQPFLLRQAVARSLIVNPELRTSELESVAVKGMLELGSVKNKAIDTKTARERRATLIECFNVVTLYPGSPLKKLLDECPQKERNTASEAIALAVRHSSREDRSLILGLLGSESRPLQHAIGSRLALDAMTDKSVMDHLEETYRTGGPSERETAAIALVQIDDEGADSRRKGILKDRRLALTTRALALHSQAADALVPNDASAELVGEIGQTLNQSEESDQFLYLAALKALKSSARSALPAVHDLAESCAGDPDRAHLLQAATSTARAIE